MDIFGRTDQMLRGGLSSDALFMSWPQLAAVNGGLGMLIQQVRVNYAQNIRRIFELGPGVIPGANGGVNAFFCDFVANPLCSLRTQPTYYIISRPEGQMQVQRYVGSEVLGQCFYRAYGSPCGANVLTMSGKAGCSGASDSPMLTWVVNGVVVNQYNADITGQESVIQEGFAAMFAGLNLWVNGLDLPCGPGGGVGGAFEGGGGSAKGSGGNTESNTVSSGGGLNTRSL